MGFLRSHKKALGYLLAFCFPVLLLLLVYIRFHMAPFGDRTVLTTDLNGQYIMYFRYFKEMLQNGNDLFYSFSMTLGGNMIGLFAYYLASPFNLILFLFPESMLDIAVMVIILLKIGTSGLTMCVFLNHQRTEEGKPFGFSAVMFSLFYALMAYSVGFQFNLMWLDGVILLPLILMGLDRLVRQKKPALYIITLTAVILFNYYIGFMICLFSVLYFVYRLFLETKSRPNRDTIRTVIRFALSSLLSGGLSAVLLVPTLLSLMGGKVGSVEEAFSFERNFALFDIYPRLFNANFIADRDLKTGLPLLFCGLLPLILCVVFYFTPCFAVKEKLASAVFFGILFISFHIMLLDTFWHGFTPPTWFPYRYSFFFSFLMVMTAYQCFLRLNLETIKRYAVKALLVLIGLLFLSEKLNKSAMSTSRFYVNIILILLLLLLLYLMKQYRHRLLPLALAAVCIADMGLNTYLTVSSMAHSNGFSYVSSSAYRRFDTELEPVVEYIKQHETSQFYRMEKTFLYSNNDAMRFNYNGLTHFSSAEKAFVREFMQKMGFRTTGNYTGYKWGSTMAADSLLGVKYLLQKDRSNNSSNYYQEYYEQNGITVLQNQFALPLGFLVNPEITAVDMDQTDLFALQNEIWSNMTGKSASLFQPIPFRQELQNMLLSEPGTLENGAPDPIREYVRTTPDSQNSFVHYYLTIEKEGPVYAYFASEPKRMWGSELYINDEPVSGYFDRNNYNIVSIGCYHPGDIVKISLQPRASKLFFSQAYFYYQDMDVFKQFCNQLSQASLTVTEHQISSSLKGTINNHGQEDKLLFLSVPSDSGWHIQVDGKPLQSITVFDAMMAVRIPPGSHKISMHFLPPGIWAGCIITGISLAVALAWVIIWYRNKKKAVYEGGRKA